MTTNKRTIDQIKPCNFGDPASVIKYAPTSGVFGSDACLGDPEEFVTAVIGKWYRIAGNTVPVETSEHVEQAKSLFPLYENFRANREYLNSSEVGQILGCLNQTGSVSQAGQLLEAALK